jgi:hypothetical protein
MLLLAMLNGRSIRPKWKASRRPRASTGREHGFRSRRLELETLEGRQLLAGVVSEFQSPTPASMTNLITFEVPGSSDTQVSAINDAGTVSGSYDQGPSSSPNGYLRDAAGNITTFDVPGLASTSVTGINNAGTVVGYSTFGYGPGFLRDATGNITTFQIPGITPGYLIGVFDPVINDAGIIAGNYSSLSDGPAHGFLRDAAGNITTFDAPGSSTTTVTAINNAGTVLGTSNSPSFPNFLRDAAGNFSILTVPGSESTVFDAINDTGTVAGTFVAGGLEHGFLRDAAGKFTTFDIPGSTLFSVSAINDFGMVAGISLQQSGMQQGFLRDAAGNVTTFNPSSSNSVVAVSLNNAGIVAGDTLFNVDRTGFFDADRTGFVGTAVAPTVISVQRFGFHSDPTRIVLGFSTGLDPIPAQDIHNYSIVGPGGQSIAVVKAAYSPQSNTVVLSLHSRLNLHLIYRLTVNGSSPGGVTDTFGTLLDGAANGLPGSNFATNITASDLVLGKHVPGGPARMAHLRGLLSTIEANQSKQLARLQHSANTHKATHRSPLAVSSGSPKLIQISVHHEKAPGKRSTVSK